MNTNNYLIQFTSSQCENNQESLHVIKVLVNFVQSWINLELKENNVNSLLDFGATLQIKLLKIACL